MPVHPPSFAVLASLWQHWQPPLLALLVALLTRVAARAMHRPGLDHQAVPVGALAAWVLLAGFDLSWHDSALQRLPMVALLLVVVSAIAASAPKIAQALPVVTAVAAAWWLSSVPRTRAALIDDLPELVIIAASTGLVMYRLRCAPVWTLLSAAVALAASLTLLGAPMPWQFAAMAVAAATVALMGRPASSADGAGDIGTAGAIALVAAAADIGVGKLPHGGLGPVDVACLAPLLAVMLSSVLGRADVVLGSVLGCAGSTVICWAVGLALAH